MKTYKNKIKKGTHEELPYKDKVHAFMVKTSFS